MLPVDQQQGIRNFIVETIISVSSDEAALRTQKTYINKLDVTLVQILKQEWPHRWPTFISDIVSSSRTSLSICENNMAILRLLSEEIFDYSAEAMTQAKTKILKNQICGEFHDVFKLCIEVLEKAQKPSLIKASLETMLRFLNWIPLGYIFETSVIDHLIGRVSCGEVQRGACMRTAVLSSCLWRWSTIVEDTASPGTALHAPMRPLLPAPTHTRPAASSSRCPSSAT